MLISEMYCITLNCNVLHGPGGWGRGDIGNRLKGLLPLVFLRACVGHCSFLLL